MWDCKNLVSGFPTTSLVEATGTFIFGVVHASVLDLVDVASGVVAKFFFVTARPSMGLRLTNVMTILASRHYCTSSMDGTGRNTVAGFTVGFAAC